MNDHQPLDFHKTLIAHTKALQSLARGLLSDPHRADDLVQETMTAALERPPGEVYSLRGWLFGVTRHLAARIMRSERRRAQREQAVARPDGAPAAEELLAREDILARLVTTFQDLPEPYRTVIHLRYFENLPPRKIAAKLHTPVKTIQSRLARAREMIRQRLTNRYGKELGNWHQALLLVVPPGKGFTLIIPVVAATAPLILILVIAFKFNQDPAGAPEAAKAGALAGTVDQTRAHPQGENEQYLSAAKTESTGKTPPPLGGNKESGPRQREALASPPFRSAHLLAMMPNMIFMEGGVTHLGISAEAAKNILESHGVKNMSSDITAMLGNHDLQVKPFYISKTEVSNQEYAAFVKATGHRFPFHFWKKENMTKCAKEWEAKNPTIRFDYRAYWENNWNKLKWEIPRHPRQKNVCKKHPVEWVSYLDALAYCRWSGSRLPTETEYIHAARRGTQKIYPWGNTWSALKAVVMKGHSRSVTNHPPGIVAGEVGEIFHLAGNAFELTSSRYEPLSGWNSTFQALCQMRLVSRPESPEWDKTSIILKGGSYANTDNTRIACMIDSRPALPLDMALKGCGFRVARSARPGLAAFLSAIQLHKKRIIPNLKPLAQETLANHQGVEAWVKDKAGSIREYHTVSFAPLPQSSDFATPAEFHESSRRSPMVIGVLYSTERIASPPLDPGLFLILYQSGKSTGLEAGKDGCLLFFQDLTTESVTKLASTKEDLKLLGKPGVKPTVIHKAGQNLVVFQTQILNKKTPPTLSLTITLDLIDDGLNGSIKFPGGR